jgi:hypothetical protein
VALQRNWIGSPNYSGRGGSGVRLIVLHTAEGATTYQSLGSYFANPSSQVSSHTGIDDTPGVVGEYVHRDQKAWTAAAANPYSVQTEMCAFAAWTPDEWNKHQTMLSNCAQWISEEAAHYGIPIVKLTASQAQDGHSSGVCQHVDLGAAGGGHYDCGTSFPMDQVISMAKGGAPAPAPTTKGGNMIASTTTGKGYWTVTTDGAVYAFGDAQYKGGPNKDKVLQPGVSVQGIAAKGNDGYWVEGTDGSIFCYGSAQMYGRPDRG